MNTSLQSNVEAIATNVRYWTEGRADNQHNDLTGWCARASAELFKQLKAEGIDAEIHAWVSPHTGQSHVFLMVDDHIVDVTATQYRELRNVPVVIMHQREAEAYEFYQTMHTFKAVGSLILWQKKTRWPKGQIAFQ
jgi:hypothetical protein